MKTIADRLRWLRKEKCHKTLEEVSKHVKVSKATIQRYESGVIENIPSDKIELLSEVLETTPGFIMGWESDPEYEKLDTRFGLALKNERERRGESIRNFAKHIGISERMLAKYERGEIIPTASTAMLIAMTAGISADEYDPIYIRMENQKKSEKLDAEIIQLFVSLSPDGKKKVLDYARLVLLGEENQVDSSSAQSSSSPTIP